MKGAQSMLNYQSNALSSPVRYQVQRFLKTISTSRRLPENCVINKPGYIYEAPEVDLISRSLMKLRLGTVKPQVCPLP